LGRQPIRDYLSATDALAAEPYVDKDRMGAVEASYGGYSVYMLAGKHQKRFKTFIAHCGLFNMESWYGATEELWFANFDLKGPYWQKPQPKSYADFNPINYVAQWTLLCMIIEGEKTSEYLMNKGLTFSCTIERIKVQVVDISDEGHWVTKPYNS
jgi:dipeptidyl aminopeptidase/acylaminoacyl peptidase